MYLLAPLIVQNLKQFLEPILWGYAISGPKMAHLPQTIFFGESHYYVYLPIGSFYCAKFKKKTLQQTHVYEDVSLLGLKWSICPKQEIFGKNH